MKVLLINPSSKFLINDMAFPAMGLLYLSSYLKKHGYNNITMIDMSARSLPDVIDFDIVGIYSNTPQFPEAFRIYKGIKAKNIKNNALYVFGGPHVSAKPGDLGDNEIVVAGEGEQAFLDIVQRYDRGAAQEKLYRLPYITDLDSIPFPDRDLINIKDYQYFISGRLATSIITTRGCPFGCYFCSNNAWGKTLRMRSAENIVEELHLLKDKYNYGAFMFWDDTMTVNRKRMINLCNSMASMDILWRCNIRSDTVDFDLLKKMKDSGCIETAIGIESGSQRILKTVNKGETVARNMEAIKNGKKAGLRVKGFFIIGLPGENRESIQETESFLDEAKLDDIDFSVYSPFPGSYIYNNMGEFDISFKDDYESSWYKGVSGKYKSLVSTSGLTSADIVLTRDRMEEKYKRKVKINA